jgi:hypothetical protein
MSRLTITLTAAAASALVAAATVALPALGDDSGSPGPDKDAQFARFVDCLHAHGLPGAPTDPATLKPWLAARESADPGSAKDALDACEPADTGKPKFDKPRELSAADVQKLVDCMHANGLDAPGDPAALKRWLAQEERAHPDEVARVMPKCKAQLDPNPPSKDAKPADCGGDATRPAEPATKPEESTT